MMTQEFKIIEEAPDGWKRLAITFNVESTPRWWQFWNMKIKPQQFTASLWVKANDIVYPTTIESTNPNI